ncbi:MAG: N-acetyltransferase family protein [Micropruina sp.]|nr:MAG: N-acetyltransferase family protein [Micropruina sp.]
MDLREATAADLPAILDIYNEAVRTTTASWDLEPVSLASRQRWFAEHEAADHPVLVAVRDGEVVGWTAYGRFRDKAGYDATMEHTVYVRADARGGGIGRALLQSLVGIARLRGVHALLGALSSENTGSLALHRSLGFVEVGRMPQVGRKFDRWLDLVWVELLLDGDDRA